MDFWLNMRHFVADHYREICTTFVAGTLIFVVIKKMRKKPRKTFPRNIIIHHQVGRGPFAPSVTPFSIKLETYLRMANVPYANEHDSYLNKSSKGKFTWIEYNDVKIADSEYCIQYINKQFAIDLNKQLSEEEKALAFCMEKLIDEHLYWLITLNRWVYEKGEKINKYLKVPGILLRVLVRKMKGRTDAQGLGLHSKEENNKLLEEDLAALSTILGGKKYLLGETPCQTDCALFGMLAQMYWQSFGGDNEKAVKKFPNLCRYCERTKEAYWPDWDDCITHGGTRKALN